MMVVMNLKRLATGELKTHTRKKILVCCSLTCSLPPFLPLSLPPSLPSSSDQKSELCIKKTQKTKKGLSYHENCTYTGGGAVVHCMHGVCGFFCVCFATCSDKGLLQEPVARARSEKLPPDAHLRDTDNQRWVPVFPHGPHHTRGRGKKRGREHPCGE